MPDSETLRILAILSDTRRRAEGIGLLSKHLHVANVVVFICDAELNIPLPAEGFPQTFPQGRVWREFVGVCMKEGTASGTLMLHDRRHDAFGIGTAEAAIVFLDGRPEPLRLEELHSALPLLAAALRHEKTLQSTSVQAALAKESAMQAHRLAETVDTIRRELQRTLEFTKAVTDSLGEGVYATNNEGVLTFVNPVAAALLGWTETELIGKPVQELILCQDAEGKARPVTAPMLSAATTGQTIHNVEEAFLRRDGTVIPVAYTSSPIRTGGELRGTVVVFQDLTERKKFEEGLHQAQKLESIGVLAGGVAHDFNNLLTGIIGNTSWALESLPEKDPIRPLLQSAMAASERAAKLTNQLLAYSGRGQFVLTTINLSCLIRETTPLIQASVPRTVTLELYLDEGLPAIEGDSTQLQQLVMNLIINGAEAIPEGRSGNVVVSTSVQKPAEYPQSSLRPRESETAGIYVDLQVSDNGCGMDEETKRKIFDPFFTTKFTGRGLGLAAVLGIVRGHKGSISVSSTPGQGSVFTVSLPATLSKIAEDSPPDAATKVGGNERILVVDDEPMVRGIATIVLTRAGYSVVEAEDGQRAVEVFQREGDQIALVLLDLTMPVMGGDTAIQRLRKIRPDCRILLSSGYSEIDVIQRLGNEEVAGFIQKPYTGSRLLHKVKTVLEQSSSRSADASQKNV